MELIPACVLAIIQGITEFLPISSSGHLILAPALFNWEDPGMAFDVALHFGSLVAILCVFRHTLIHHWQQFRETGLKANDTKKFVMQIGIATLPACIVGLLMRDFIDSHLRSPFVVATTTICFGLLLGWADRRKNHSTREHLTLTQAFLIGCMQSIALIPGTSRSGITISAGLLLGLSRHRATEFSFLLAIPTIGLAFLYESFKLYRHGLGTLDLPITIIAVAVSAVSSYAAMRFLFFWVRKRSFMPFVIYRIALGIGLFLFFS